MPTERLYTVRLTSNEIHILKHAMLDIVNGETDAKTVHDAWEIREKLLDAEIAK